MEIKMANENNGNAPTDRQEQHNKVINLSREGHRHLKAQRFAQARKAFSEGLEMEPNNPYLLTGMGDLFVYFV